MATTIVKLTKDILPIYRELYINHWPKHVVTFCLFEHFIDRIEKHPEWYDKVHFYKLSNGDCKIDYDATFVFVNGSHIYIDSLTRDFAKLEKLLNLLDYNEEKTFIIIRDEFRGLIHDIIRINFLEKTFETGAKCGFHQLSDAQELNLDIQ